MQHGGHLDPRQRDFLERQNIVQRIDFLENCVRKLNQHSRQITAEGWRIYCLTTDPASVLMWSHYGSCHAGICLEFDASIPVIGNARKVTYVSQRPTIDWQVLQQPAKLTESILLG
jgi:hypothetical protein